MTRNRWIGCGIGVVSTILLTVAGCSKDEGDTNKKDAKPTVQVEQKKDNLGKPIQAQPTSFSKADKLPTFKQSVLLDAAPEGEQRPPEMTYNGKNAVKIFETIANGLWNETTFADNDGKRIKYRSVIKTDLGEIHVDLLGDHAPSHVRNFVCLAKTGYYDGMGFYYSINRKVEEGTVAYIETGCPRGTGEAGSGSIGYWLRPEFSEKLTHTEGVLGACLGEDVESAACRFYIMAEPNPYMDGKFTIFGRVTKGMDIVRAINKRPVGEFDRAVNPVVIRSVTIQTIAD
jgi:cyclophilin family peptidyl-prolyl cis-trans isomerase